MLSEFCRQLLMQDHVEIKTCETGVLKCFQLQHKYSHAECKQPSPQEKVEQMIGI